MQKLLPPLCLFLALACAITGFTLLAVPAPEPGLELHRARVEGDDDYREVLEGDLVERQWWRRALIAGAFTGAVLFAAAAFLAPSVAREK